MLACTEFACCAATVPAQSYACTCELHSRFLAGTFLVEVPSPKKSCGEGPAGDAKQGREGQNSLSEKAVIYFGLIVKLLQIARKLFKDLGD